jgi:hypothetical protein
MPKSLTIKTDCYSEAKYHLGERKHSNTRASHYIKNMATREVRRNAKVIIKYEGENV